MTPARKSSPIFPPPPRAGLAFRHDLGAPAGRPPGPPLKPYELLDRVLSMAGAAVCPGRSKEALRLTNLGERLLPVADEARRLRPISLEQAAAMSAEMREVVETAAQQTMSVPVFFDLACGRVEQ